MAYTAFKMICENPDDFPPDSYPEVQKIAQYAKNPTIQTVIKIFGGSRAEFSRRYGIPIRTLEDWTWMKRNPPQYVLDLLAYAVISDKHK